jgi:hypothetical protein
MTSETPPTGRDPRAGDQGGDPSAAIKLQILATEHWSLLATRSLTYTEALNRVTIFLAILSGAVIAISLVAQADHFGIAFSAIAIFLLSVVLFTGVTTISRLNALNRDDYRWVVGMNRLRHAYLEMYPELAPHLITSPYDDLPGALRTLGIDDMTVARGLGSTFHLLQTLPGMLTVIVGAVAGAIGALLALVVNAPPAGMVAAAVVAFVVVIALMRAEGRRAVTGTPPSLISRFPTPPTDNPPGPPNRS